MAEHSRIRQAQNTAFDQALRARGFKPAEGQWEWSTETERAQMKQTQLIELTIGPKGKGRRVLAGPVYNRAAYDDRPRDLVVDAEGSVWEATRQQTVTTTTTVDVEACQWGCFGQPPSGDDPGEQLGRNVWPLARGQPFKGEVAIEFAAPHLDVRYAYLDCPYPD